MRHFRENFPTFSNITHRFSFLWLLLHLSNETRLKFHLAHFSHHASSWPSKDRCIWSRFIPPGLPQLDDQKKSCTLPPLSFYASATVFNWDLSALRSSKARRYSYERPRSGSNWDLSPDLCSQTFQLLFHLLYPHLKDGKGPIQGHGGQLICPPQMGAWPKYANNVLAPGLQIF